MNVAMRTERVYDGMIAGERGALIDRLKRYYGCGVWAGKLFVICCIIDCLIAFVSAFIFG